MSSHKEESDFTPFDISKVEVMTKELTSTPNIPEVFEGAKSDFKPLDSAGSTEFHVPDWYLTSISADPLIKRQLEKIVESRVAILLDAKLKD